TLRPGVDPPVVTVVSSQPSVGEIQRSPVRVLPGGSQPSTVDFVPLASGDADVTVIQPPGFVVPTGFAKLSFHVTAPSFTGTNFTMARDTMISLGVQLGSGVQTSDTNLNITLTSGDPSKLLLSATPDSAPSPSITTVLVAGTYSTNPFFVH